MRASSACSLCGHAYTHPVELDIKTGMHCASCGALIYAVTGLPFGEPPAAEAGGPTRKPASQTPLSHSGLPPVKRQPAPANPEEQAPRNRQTAIIPDDQKAGDGFAMPAAAILAWLLSLCALILAFVIFPSYDNTPADALYMIQWQPTIIFGCTAAILFIQGMIAAARR